MKNKNGKRVKRAGKAQAVTWGSLRRSLLAVAVAQAFTIAPAAVLASYTDEDNNPYPTMGSPLALPDGGSTLIIKGAANEVAVKNEYEDVTITIGLGSELDVDDYDTAIGSDTRAYIDNEFLEISMVGFSSLNIEGGEASLTGIDVESGAYRGSSEQSIVLDGNTSLTVDNSLAGVSTDRNAVGIAISGDAERDGTFNIDSMVDLDVVVGSADNNNVVINVEARSTTANAAATGITGSVGDVSGGEGIVGPLEDSSLTIELSGTDTAVNVYAATAGLDDDARAEGVAARAELYSSAAVSLANNVEVNTHAYAEGGEASATGVVAVAYEATATVDLTDTASVNVLAGGEYGADASAVVLVALDGEGSRSDVTLTMSDDTRVVAAGESSRGLAESHGIRAYAYSEGYAGSDTGSTVTINLQDSAAVDASASTVTGSSKATAIEATLSTRVEDVNPNAQGSVLNVTLGNSDTPSAVALTASADNAYGIIVDGESTSVYGSSGNDVNIQLNAGASIVVNGEGGEGTSAVQGTGIGVVNENYVYSGYASTVTVDLDDANISVDADRANGIAVVDFTEASGGKGGNQLWQQDITLSGTSDLDVNGGESAVGIGMAGMADVDEYTLSAGSQVVTLEGSASINVVADNYASGVLQTGEILNPGIAASAVEQRVTLSGGEGSSVDLSVTGDVANGITQSASLAPGKVSIAFGGEESYGATEQLIELDNANLQINGSGYSAAISQSAVNSGLDVTQTVTLGASDEVSVNVYSNYGAAGVSVSNVSAGGGEYGGSGSVSQTVSLNSTDLMVDSDYGLAVGVQASNQGLGDSDQVIGLTNADLQVGGESARGIFVDSDSDVIGGESAVLNQRVTLSDDVQVDVDASYGSAVGIALHQNVDGGEGSAADISQQVVLSGGESTVMLNVAAVSESSYLMAVHLEADNNADEGNTTQNIELSQVAISAVHSGGEGSANLTAINIEADVDQDGGNATQSVDLTDTTVIARNDSTGYDATADGIELDLIGDYSSGAEQTINLSNSTITATAAADAHVDGIMVDAELIQHTESISQTATLVQSQITTSSQGGGHGLNLDISGSADQAIQAVNLTDSQIVASGEDGVKGIEVEFDSGKYADTASLNQTVVLTGSQVTASSQDDTDGIKLDIDTDKYDVGTGVQSVSLIDSQVTASGLDEVTGIELDNDAEGGETTVELTLGSTVTVNAGGEGSYIDDDADVRGIDADARYADVDVLLDSSLVDLNLNATLEDGDYFDDLRTDGIKVKAESLLVSLAAGSSVSVDADIDARHSGGDEHEIYIDGIDVEGGEYSSDGSLVVTLAQDSSVTVDIDGTFTGGEGGENGQSLELSGSVIEAEAYDQELAVNLNGSSATATLDLEVQNVIDSDVTFSGVEVDVRRHGGENGVADTLVSLSSSQVSVDSELVLTDLAGGEGSSDVLHDIAGIYVNSTNYSSIDGDVTIDLSVGSTVRADAQTSIGGEFGSSSSGNVETNAYGILADVVGAENISVDLDGSAVVTIASNRVTTDVDVDTYAYATGIQVDSAGAKGGKGGEGNESGTINVSLSDSQVSAAAQYSYGIDIDSTRSLQDVSVTLDDSQVLATSYNGESSELNLGIEVDGTATVDISLTNSGVTAGAYNESADTDVAVGVTATARDLSIDLSGSSINVEGNELALGVAARAADGGEGATASITLADNSAINAAQSGGEGSYGAGAVGVVIGENSLFGGELSGARFADVNIDVAAGSAIRATGSDSYYSVGVAANSSDVIELTNAGVIAVDAGGEGGQAIGSLLYADGNITLHNSGDISAVGAYVSYGVLANSESGTVDLSNSGNILVEGGVSAIAVKILADEATVTNSGDILASSELGFSYGIVGAEPMIGPAVRSLAPVAAGLTVVNQANGYIWADAAIAYSSSIDNSGTIRGRIIDGGTLVNNASGVLHADLNEESVVWDRELREIPETVLNHDVAPTAYWDVDDATLVDGSKVKIDVTDVLEELIVAEGSEAIAGRDYLLIETSEGNADWSLEELALEGTITALNYSFIEDTEEYQLGVNISFNPCNDQGLTQNAQEACNAAITDVRTNDPDAEDEGRIEDDYVDDLIEFLAAGGEDKELTPDVSNAAKNISAGAFRVVGDAIHFRMNNNIGANGPQGLSSGEEAVSERGLWLEGRRIDSEHDGDEQVGKITSDVDVFTLGYDFALGNSWTYGMALSTAEGDSKENGTGDKANADGVLLAGYGFYQKDDWYTEIVLGYGQWDNDTARSIAGDKITASFDSEQYDFRVMGGKTYSVNGWEITPQAGIQYSHIEVDGYTEKGTTGLELKVNDQEYDVLEGGIGASFRYPVKLANGVLTFGSEVMGWHDFENEVANVEASFLGGQTSFISEGVKQDATRLDTSFVLEYQTGNGFTAEFSYGFNSNSDFDSETYRAKAYWRF